MSHLRESSSWTLRYKENEEDVVDPIRRYYLIFEGENIEAKYFEGIDNCRKEIGINCIIELIILNGYEETKNHSHPKNLLDLVTEKKAQLKGDGKYDEGIDKFVIVFDRDSFKSSSEFLDFLSSVESENILGLTSPCFELWLILHYDKSLATYVLMNKEDIFCNKRMSNNHTCTSKLFSDISGMNPNLDIDFYKLKDKVGIAIEQERLLQQENKAMANNIGSNIGLLIEMMRQDPRRYFQS